MVPKHIGIILDGNRRFAKRLMLKPWKGHEWGAKKVEKLFEWCRELDIKELTLYAFSLENLSRPKEEFDCLMQIFRSEFNKLLFDERIDKDEIRINFIGRLGLLPQDLQDIMQKVMKKTERYSRHIINFAMAYGGRAEIIDAARKIADKASRGEIDINSINEDVFSQHLYLNSKPDLIIRTGGEKRISGFLLYQGDYAELCFVDKMWPEFEKADLVNAINDYAERDRRFGR
ncbi:di-trans,poly-cis-decaprenylcistransferase [Candidatus Woesearchaeota archaeon]|nr:di-trans,poly-cis-decaprenylcistransferase [Candidatus Pacearchaeota archaeon]MBI4452081.1 di-trans,poly-cis-decaprenylcistransferase [Candidatus Woesearchaeota archaeon]